MKQAYVIKIVVAGEGAVGKTSLIQRYVYNEFVDTKMTIGVSFTYKDITIDNRYFKLSLWDFAGETNFRFVLERFCFGAVGALLVFDLTRIVSFHTLPEWVTLINKGAGAIPIVLVGNKSDLAQQTNCGLTNLEIDAFWKKFELKEYIESSAKDDLNVEGCFKPSWST